MTRVSVTIQGGSRHGEVFQLDTRWRHMHLAPTPDEADAEPGDETGMLLPAQPGGIPKLRAPGTERYDISEPRVAEAGGPLVAEAVYVPEA